MNIIDYLGISGINLYTWIVYGALIGIIMHNRNYLQPVGRIFFTIFYAVSGALAGGLMANFLIAKPMKEFSTEAFLLSITLALIVSMYYTSTMNNNMRTYKYK